MEQHFTYVKHRNHLKAINWSITLVKSQLISEQTRNQMKFPLQSISKQQKKRGEKKKKCGEEILFQLLFPFIHAGNFLHVPT